MDIGQVQVALENIKKTIGMEPAPMAQWFSYSLCTREIPGSVPGGDLKPVTLLR